MKKETKGLDLEKLDVDVQFMVRERDGLLSF